MTDEPMHLLCCSDSESSQVLLRQRQKTEANLQFSTPLLFSNISQVLHKKLRSLRQH